MGNDLPLGHLPHPNFSSFSFWPEKCLGLLVLNVWSEIREDAKKALK